MFRGGKSASYPHHRLLLATQPLCYSIPPVKMATVGIRRSPRRLSEYARSGGKALGGPGEAEGPLVSFRRVDKSSPWTTESLQKSGRRTHFKLFRLPTQYSLDDAKEGARSIGSSVEILSPLHARKDKSFRNQSRGNPHHKLGFFMDSKRDADVVVQELDSRDGIGLFR